VTDNPSIQAPINFADHVQILPYNDVEALKKAVDNETCAVIVEGIQGVGGINVATDEFMKAIRKACDKTGAIFIHDSVQCGYGRSGKFFTFQHSGVNPNHHQRRKPCHARRTAKDEGQNHMLRNGRERNRSAH
jgi:acetylornithine aminotransferase